MARLSRGLGGTFEGHFIVNPRQMQELLSSPQGPVYRDLIKKAGAVRDEAKRRVGVYRLRPGEKRKRRPGTLQRSIVVRKLQKEGGGRGLVAVVGSENPIALLHHEGTIPHVIRPRPGNKRGLLVFYWDKVGHVVSMREVNHPGTKPNRYLTDSLRAINRTR